MRMEGDPWECVVVSFHGDGPTQGGIQLPGLGAARTPEVRNISFILRVQVHLRGESMMRQLP